LIACATVCMELCQNLITDKTFLFRESHHPRSRSKDKKKCI
jgi:hypothetical protein